VLDLAVLVAAHVAVDLVLSHLRRRGHDLRRVLLVGTGLQPRLLAVRLRDREPAGLQLIGYLSPPDEPPLDSLRRYGDFSTLRSVVREERVDEVVIALPASAHEETLRLDAELRDTDVSVRILPDVFELVAMRAQIEDFYGLPLISLREPSMNPAQAAVKRAFDVVVAGILFTLSLPLFLLIALWIRLDSPGPILIHQRRVGAGGRIFPMHKFRSMQWNPADLDTAVDKVRNDPRVTRAGRFLRRSSLDELPQLWNVVRGDMSLVGPRPELPAIVERYEPWQRKRFNVPPGMTGWWQVNGRGDQEMHLNTEIDLFYVQNYSILLDVQILLHTVGAVIRGKGAF
jgi:exopolysaccharide biosynthesis polyprenyl glycosylphosphotransferase